MIDVTDETFEAEVLEKSATVPVVVDLWAEWCGPCKTLGPILERVIGETAGRVVGVKVDVEANPQVSQAFQVQSIPAVYALYQGAVVDTFVGAQPESEVVQFIQRLLDISADGTAVDGTATDDTATDGAAGSAAEASTHQVSEPGAEAQPLPPEVEAPPAASEAEMDAAEARLAELLPLVKTKDEARVEFLELLEVLGAENPATPEWRKKLSSALF